MYAPSPRRALVPALAMAAALLAAACAHQAPERPGAAKELIALHAQWADARVRGDTAFLERFYGQELRIQAANGDVVERGDDIARFAARDIKPEYIRDTELRVLDYGDAAVVTGIESLKGAYRGVPGEMALRFTNVLVRRDGRWQLVAHQSTPTSAR